MLITIALRTTLDPTDRSMPPDAITAVMPIAMIATKAKLRATLKRFLSLAKESVSKVSARHATIAATRTQNDCRLVIRVNQFLCSLVEMTSSTVVIGLPPSCRLDRTGDETGDFFW
jgi:hypothetical protein